MAKKKLGVVGWTVVGVIFLASFCIAPGVNLIPPIILGILMLIHKLTTNKKSEGDQKE